MTYLRTLGNLFKNMTHIFLNGNISYDYGVYDYKNYRTVKGPPTFCSVGFLFYLCGMETKDNVLNNSLVYYLGDNYLPITEESIELGEYNKFLTVVHREGLGGDRNIHLSYRDNKK